MPGLKDRVTLNMMVFGGNIADYFKINSLFFYEKYQKTDLEVELVRKEKIRDGGFYFFHYKDQSNWNMWAPVFVTNYKKFGNKIIIFGVNFNFIPLQFRDRIFDKFITERDFDKNLFIPAKYDKVYKELQKVGFEYALMEFDASLIVKAHRIHLDLLARFLYSQHPKNKYDPKKLMQIWEKKLETRDQRDKEMTMAMMNEFYDIQFDISDKYSTLKNHIERIRAGQIKYGRGK